MDATDGHGQLVNTAGAGGRLQAGRFWGSKFEVRQSRGGRGMTTLLLRGGDFSVCLRPASRARHAGVLASASYIRRDPVRRLWGATAEAASAHSAATARRPSAARAGLPATAATAR